MTLLRRPAETELSPLSSPRHQVSMINSRNSTARSVGLDHVPVKITAPPKNTHHDANIESLIEKMKSGLEVWLISVPSCSLPQRTVEKKKKNLYLPSAVLIAQRLVGPYRNTYICLERRLSVKRYLFEFICHSPFASISNPCRKRGVNFFLVRQSVKVTCIRRKNGQPSKIFVMHKSCESLACSSSVFE